MCILSQEVCTFSLFLGKEKSRSRYAPTLISVPFWNTNGISNWINDLTRQKSSIELSDDWVNELKQDIEYTASIQGTPQKRQAVLYCRRLGIDYKKLTDLEFEVLIRIMQKSKHLQNSGGGKNRGKKRK